MTDEDFSEQVGISFSQIPLFITELNAFAEAMNLNSTNGTSTTSLLIENAVKNLTVETGKSYLAGQTLKIAATASPTNWMVGDVTAYNTATGLLSVSVQYKQGSGTFAAWSISLSPPVPVTIPSTTVMLFYEDTAPIGWTQRTDIGSNHALKVVNTGGGTVAGTIDFSTVFASKSVAGTVSNTTLSKAQIPPHVHTYERAFTGSGNGLGGSAPFITVGSVTNTSNGSGDTLNGDSHTHTFTGTAINLDVKYLKMIVAEKD